MSQPHNQNQSIVGSFAKNDLQLEASYGYSPLCMMRVSQIFDILQFVAAWCQLLQCIAVLQCVAVYCGVSQWFAACCSVSQCIASYFCVSQCGTVCRSVLQCVVAWCSVLQRVAICCGVLQHTIKVGHLLTCPFVCNCAVCASCSFAANSTKRHGCGSGQTGHKRNVTATLYSVWRKWRHKNLHISMIERLCRLLLSVGKGSTGREWG